MITTCRAFATCLTPWTSCSLSHRSDQTSSTTRNLSKSRRTNKEMEPCSKRGTQGRLVSGFREPKLPVVHLHSSRILFTALRDMMTTSIPIVTEVIRGRRTPRCSTTTKPLLAMRSSWLELAGAMVSKSRRLSSRNQCQRPLDQSFHKNGKTSSNSWLSVEAIPKFQKEWSRCRTDPTICPSNLKLRSRK